MVPDGGAPWSPASDLVGDPELEVDSLLPVLSGGADKPETLEDEGRPRGLYPSHSDAEREAARVGLRFRGVMFNMLASLGFGTMHLLARVGTVRMGTTVALHIFFRGIVTVCAASSFIGCGGIPTIRRADVPAVALRGLVGCISLFTKFQAVSRLRLSDAVAVMFTSPAMAIVLSRVFLGEPAQLVTVVASVCSFGGVLAIAHGEEGATGGEEIVDGSTRLAGIAFGLTGAFLQATAYTMTRWIGKKCHSQYNVLSLGVWSLLLAPVAMREMTGELVALGLSSRVIFAVLVGTGFASYVGASAVNRALQILGAGTVSVLRAVDIPLSLLLGYLFLNERHMSVGSISGTVIICLSSIVLGYASATRPAK